jgi:hypothetical protein
VRLEIELAQEEDGSVCGAVTRDRDTEPFSGWLHLLELLETALSDDGAS